MRSLNGPPTSCPVFGSILAFSTALVGCSLTEEPFESLGTESATTAMLGQRPYNGAAGVDFSEVEGMNKASCDDNASCSEDAESNAGQSFSEDSANLRFNGSTISDGDAPAETAESESPKPIAQQPEQNGDASTQAIPTCSDQVQNASETDVDCGGQCATRCTEGLGCAVSSDCQVGECSLEGFCVASACVDGIQNQDETAVDCGGSCAAACEAGSTCLTGNDCQAGICGAQQCENDSPLCCQAARCDDNIHNGDEGGVDCGGAVCARCTDGQACRQSSDCTNDNCSEGQCISCGSGTVDGTETDIDCGGSDPACQRCGDGQLCQQASDCGNNNCLNGRCISCGSGTVDGSETDTDCGGDDPACQRCRPGQRCLVNGDCQDNSCQGGFC